MGELVQLQCLITSWKQCERTTTVGHIGYWRKCVPRISEIACPLHDLFKKHGSWDLTPRHIESLSVLKGEFKAYQCLGPLHPLFFWSSTIPQDIPEGTKRPKQTPNIFLHLRKKTHSGWEKGLLSLTKGVKEAKKLRTSQDIVVQGPFPLLKSVLKEHFHLRY